jgi:hypothetical protein
VKGHFIARHNHFIVPIIKQLELSGFECSLAPDFNVVTVPPMTEFIWVDFATNDALAVQNFVTPALKILRIHAYEVYTDIIKMINPAAWHRIIFVNKHMKQVCEQVWGQPDNLEIISNYVDVNAMTIPEGKQLTNKVCYAGYFNRKKGINEMYLLARQHPEYEFHLAGTAQEADLWEYMTTCKPPNVYLYPWQDDLPAFYRDKSFFINTSVRESAGVAMIEAACCGLKPLVYNWIGAGDIYPASCIWDRIDLFADVLTKNHESPDTYRAHVIESLGLGTVIWRIASILMAEPKDLPAPTVTVGIVQTRNKYLPELFQSLDLQGYEIEIDLLDNRAREKTIGQCFNELADRCTTDFILYVGDDDMLSEDYVFQAMSAYIKRQHMFPEVVGVVTGATLFDETGKTSLTAAIPTGFWKADFIRKSRFDESLLRQVDTEFFQRFSAKFPEHALLRLSWIYGYFYRQHGNNISGNKFQGPANTSQEPVK